MSVTQARRTVQGHHRTGSTTGVVSSRLMSLSGLIGVAVAFVLATVFVVSGAVAAQDAPPATPGRLLSEASLPAAPSVPADGAPTEPPPVTATVPIETPTGVPSAPPTETPVPTETPAPTGTIPPTESPTVTPPTPTLTPSVGPTVAPTEPPVIIAPTEPPATEPPTGPDSVPDQGQDATSPNGPVTLTDRFDNPAMRLLGETGRNDSLITGRYEDGAYRLEIEGPEVAPDLIAFVRSPIMADATIHVSARLDGTTDGRYVMATCREVTGYGGYRAYLSPEDGFFAITRFEPGAVPTPLQQGFADELVQGNNTFDFDFSCNGYVLELEVNGETIGIAADNSFAAGTISIGTGFFVNAATGPVTAVFQELEVSGNVAMADHADRSRRGQTPGNQLRAVAEPSLTDRRH